MEQNRIEWVDSLKGIAIITIVWRHIADLGIIGHVNCLFLQFLNSFHVPLFFFISGMFALKNLNVANVKSIWTFLKNKFIRLIFPFIVFGCVYHLTVNSLAKFPGYWFLPAMFYCMIFGLIYKVFEKTFFWGVNMLIS